MKPAKSFLVLITLTFLATCSFAEPVTSKPAKANSLPDDPDKAWREVENASKAPPQPKEWNGQPPTPAQKEEFQKFLGQRSADAAAIAREFYTRFPDHAKAAEAKDKEQRFLQQAVQYGNVAVIDQAQANMTDDQKLQLKINAIQKRAMEKRSQGLPAVLKEFETGIRELIKENPNRPDLWQALFIVAQNGDPETAKRVLADIIDSKADEETIGRAKGILKAMGAVGRPLEISFTALDGRQVDIQKMKGKVILVDFWASWCGPCMASLPDVIDLYKKNHEKGFEIVGINLDKNRKAIETTLEKYEIPWPQYFDGAGWGNKISMEYNVSAIPAMWLVDKKGILRTMNAREDLEKQVADMLAEKL